MFTKKTPEPTLIDEAINVIIVEMRNKKATDPEYAVMVSQLERLYKLKEIDSPKKRVSPDTVALIAGNLAGILLILNYERAHVVTSKALGFVMKAK